jgi:hypothetical protein
MLLFVLGVSVGGTFEAKGELETEGSGPLEAERVFDAKGEFEAERLLETEGEGELDKV